MKYITNKYSATVELINAIETVRMELRAGELGRATAQEQNEVYKRLLHLYSLIQTHEIKELIQQAA